MLTHIVLLVPNRQPSRGTQDSITAWGCAVVNAATFAFAWLDRHVCWQVAEKIGSTPMHEVDAHNVVPCWEVSPKREYAARTIRSKIHKQLPEFFKVCRLAPHLPPTEAHPFCGWAVDL